MIKSDSDQNKEKRGKCKKIPGKKARGRRSIVGEEDMNGENSPSPTRPPGTLHSKTEIPRQLLAVEIRGRRPLQSLNSNDG